ncbi:hypothetical protein Q7499_11180 [Glaesserella parasuis]|nr:hypothetical protein [Glaesserella parasuis]
MKIKLPKLKLPNWLTFKNVMKTSVLIFSLTGMVTIWFNLVLGYAFLTCSSMMYVVYATLEVREMKEWHKDSIDSLVKTAEITARIAYKLKQLSGTKVTINGKEIN